MHSPVLGEVGVGMSSGDFNCALVLAARGRVCKMLQIWWLWERPWDTMMKINPGGKENVIKGHSNTLDVRREEKA